MGQSLLEGFKISFKTMALFKSFQLIKLNILITIYDK